MVSINTGKGTPRRALRPLEHIKSPLPVTSAYRTLYIVICYRPISVKNILSYIFLNNFKVQKGKINVGLQTLQSILYSIDYINVDIVSAIVLIFYWRPFNQKSLFICTVVHINKLFINISPSFKIDMNAPYQVRRYYGPHIQASVRFLSLAY